METVNIKMKQD